MLVNKPCQMTCILTILVDDPDLIRGMPVNVQIVTGKFGEEKAVAVAKAIEEALRMSE